MPKPDYFILVGEKSQVAKVKDFFFFDNYIFFSYQLPFSGLAIYITIAKMLFWMLLLSVSIKTTIVPASLTYFLVCFNQNVTYPLFLECT